VASKGGSNGGANGAVRATLRAHGRGKWKEQKMELNDDIDLLDLVTIEQNLCTDEVPASDSDDESLHASASAFLIG
jgi:hypothetical protein